MIIDGREFEFKKLTMEYRAKFLEKQKQWKEESLEKVGDNIWKVENNIWNDAINKCLEVMEIYNCSGWETIKNKETGESKQKEFNIVTYIESFKKESDIIEPLILSVNEDKKHWNWFINFAIKKNFLWKYFRVIPRQLRYGNIGIEEGEGLLVDFFLYLKVKLLAPLTQSESTTNSMTDSIPQ